MRHINKKYNPIKPSYNMCISMEKMRLIVYIL